IVAPSTAELARLFEHGDVVDASRAQLDNCQDARGSSADNGNFEVSLRDHRLLHQIGARNDIGYHVDSISSFSRSGTSDSVPQRAEQTELSCDRDGLHAIGCAELTHDVVQVGSDRGSRKSAEPGNFSISIALCHKPET